MWNLALLTKMTQRAVYPISIAHEEKAVKRKGFGGPPRACADGEVLALWWHLLLMIGKQISSSWRLTSRFMALSA